MGDDEAKLSRGGTDSKSSMLDQVISFLHTEIFNCLKYKAGMHSRAASTVPKKKRIFDLAVTNLECWLPKMEESVSRGIKNEAAASRCTL